MRRKFAWNGYALSLGVFTVALAAVIVGIRPSGAGTPDPIQAKLEQRFVTVVQPFLQTYCTVCHGKDKPQAQLDLSAYKSMASVQRDGAHWALVLEKLAAKQMPPPDFGKQPTAKQRDAVMAWIGEVRKWEAQRNAGDPGAVLARRLSNAEYDYTVRDLTGVDLRPTREFPVDPANQEGFDNSGESLTISPALMKKYVQAAKGVSEHLVLTTNGFAFATHPVLAETDRDKFCVLRIVDFYRRQPTDYADYFQAAWRYKNRAALGIPSATLQTVAADAKISPRYLDLIWKTLTASEENVGVVANLQARWNALPAPDKQKPNAERAGCEALRDWVAALRKKTAWKFANLKVPGGFSEGGQCFVLWKDRAYATHRRMLRPDTLQIGGVPPSHTVRVRQNGKRTEQTVTDSVDAELFVPQNEAERAPYVAAWNRFCAAFPDTFYIEARGRMFDNTFGDFSDKARLLSAGFHNQMGYFRDDAPLMELILDNKGRQELNRLWQDFDTVALVPERMHLEFIFYERAESGTIKDKEFDFARSEDKDAISDAKIQQLATVYLNKARKNGGEPLALQAIEEHFQRTSAVIRATEKARTAAEPAHLNALLQFARRAYRRPLSEKERIGLLAFYRALRQKDGLNHEEAIRDAVASVLMSPNFLFRLDLDASAAAPEASPKSAVARTVANENRAKTPPPNNSKNGVQTLSDYALASRLSYFLWSSLPDDELLSHAAAGDLHRPEVLAAQSRRMLRDPRVRALALEWGGNWLDFRRFEEHNAVDRERFPVFTDDLRQSMFEEPLHFLADTMQNNRSVLDWLHGKHTFVNAALARHYGMNDVKPEGNQWVRVENADRYGRGGLLPMAVFLTKNSPGLRTSPVKRGYWVVRRVLGEYIPPPPPTVPELPQDESKLGNLTLRQALARHRENPACAGCHARFDSYGLVFEGYGPVGELRSKDLGGKPVDANAPFPNSKDRSGVTGLQEFIRERRQQNFLDTLSRKLLSYALGRSLQPSDDLLLAQMQKRLTADNNRFGSLVETIVTSRQFRTRRATRTTADMTDTTKKTSNHKEAKSAKTKQRI